MKIKAIVLDIDGTLLTSDRRIDCATKKALMAAQKKGVRLILASGRPPNGMWHLAEELEMEKNGGYLVAFNGASVFNCQTKEEIMAETMSASLSSQIVEHVLALDLIPMINKDDYLYVEDVFGGIIDVEDPYYQNIIKYEARGNGYLLKEAKPLVEYIDFPVHKILVAGDPAYLHSLEEKLMEPFAKQVTGAYSAPFYFEYTNQNTDKGKTLTRLFEKLSLKQETIVAFGDGHNDLSMLNSVGQSVAMGNAVEEVKRAAKYVTKSNNQAGIAEFLQEE